MTSMTHTQAGLLAHAGAARPDAVTGTVSHPALLDGTTGALAIQGVYGIHRSASWTVGATAKPKTSMVFDRKNRPTRPLSERSP